MNPKPAKAGSPKGPQPVISFRITPEHQELIHAVRALEPHSEPGLIPPSVGSDPEFCRWLILDNLARLNLRLRAQIKLKDLVIQNNALSERMNQLFELRQKKFIDEQCYKEENDVLENNKRITVSLIHHLCAEYGTPLPNGYIPDGNMIIIDKIFKNEVCFEMYEYLKNNDVKTHFSIEKKKAIAEFAAIAGWDLDSVEGQRAVLGELIDGHSDAAKAMAAFYSADKSYLMGLNEMAKKLK
jgi:hypothetical protein